MKFLQKIVYLFIVLPFILIHQISIFFICNTPTTWKLCVSTSGVEWSNWADVSLLTGLHILRTVDSATARHEHVAQQNANGTAWKNLNLANHFKHSWSVPITRSFFKAVFLVKRNSFFCTYQFQTYSPFRRNSAFYILFQCVN